MWDSKPVYAGMENLFDALRCSGLDVHALLKADGSRKYSAWLYDQVRPSLMPGDGATARHNAILSAQMKEMGEFKVTEFTVKDSGERSQFASGMQRDTTTGKVRYDLVFDGPMFERLAAHLTKGAVKYEPRNWMKANSPEELARFRESAIRHFMLWVQGVTDEDHAAAVIFNLNGFEYVKDKLGVCDVTKPREVVTGGTIHVDSAFPMVHGEKP